MVRITKKIMTVGGSCGVILGKELLKKLQVKKGDFIELDIHRVDFKNTEAKK